MPPLAYRIYKELALPEKQRTFEDCCDLLSRLSDVHFFEISNIEEAAYELSRNPAAFSGAPATTFLPAPRTWLESSNGPGDRFGWLLCEKPNGKVEYAMAHRFDATCFEGEEPRFEFGTLSPKFREIDLTAQYSDHPERWEVDYLIPAYLLFINSPKVIGRRHHEPHKGLSRELRNAHGGKFPLNAWTEIRLEIDARDAAVSEPGEGHLMGPRALHFCRRHLRIRQGRLENVRAHWRGDPHLGTKQTRYKVG